MHQGCNSQLGTQSAAQQSAQRSACWVLGLLTVLTLCHSGSTSQKRLSNMPRPVETQLLILTVDLVITNETKLNTC